MQYKLIKNSLNDIDNFLETVLINRNIKDIETFKKSNKRLIENNTYIDLDNIADGVKLLVSHMDKKSKITLIVDPDVDGITSSAILYNYLKKAYGDISFITPISHSGKGHGLDKDVTVPKDTEFIIIPDAGSSDNEEISKYKNKNVDVLVIDHHIPSEEISKDAIIINNQISKKYLNKDFSGVGVVYRFLQALDDELLLNYSDDYLDLVSIGLVADLMNTSSYETRYYIQEGLRWKNLKNPFLKQLLKLKKQPTDDIERYITALDAAFNIAPILNATMRLGTETDKLDVFKCFTLTTEELENNNFGKDIFQMCSKFKDVQNESKKQATYEISKIITDEQIKNDKIIIIDGTDIINKSLSGLTAIELTSIYKRPVLVGRVTDNVFGGSARNYSGFPCQDLKLELSKTNLFSMLEGHPNSFGWSMPYSNAKDVVSLWNNKYKDVQIEGYYDVDFILPYNELTNTDFYLVNTYKYIWGTGVEEPLFAITDIPFIPSYVKLMGAKKNTLKYSFQGKDFIMFNLPENHELLELIQNYDVKDSFNIDFVGKLGMNSFMGRTTPNVIVTDYELKKYKPN